MQNSVIVYHNPNHATPEQDIKKVVIWLHGLGASGDDFVPVVPELGLHHAVKFIFPNAPMMPVTVNGGYVMPAWYDILQMSDISREVDIASIRQSAERILAIVRDEVARGVALSDIVIAGFSQGGAVAYHVAMSLGGFGGLLPLSTYFASSGEFDDNTLKAHKDLPIFVNHGQFDGTVSPFLGQQAVQILQAWGFQPVLKTYPMAHQVCMEQIGDIGRWLNQLFDKS